MPVNNDYEVGQCTCLESTPTLIHVHYKSGKKTQTNICAKCNGTVFNNKERLLDGLDRLLVVIFALIIFLATIINEMLS